MRLAPFFVMVSIAACSTALAAGGYPACKDKAAMARTADLADQADYQAAYQLLLRGMKSKDCQIIPADKLIVEVTPPFSRLVKVHRRGEPDEFWIMN